MGSLVLQIWDQIPVRRLLNARRWVISPRLQMSSELMGPDIERALKSAFSGEDTRYFSPMTIGNTPASEDAGAQAILDGIKTTTSSPFWDWPDGRIPFVGALSVLLDGQRRMRAIIETQRVEIISFGSVDESLALAKAIEH
jgi:ASCH domain